MDCKIVLHACWAVYFALEVFSVAFALTLHILFWKLVPFSSRDISSTAEGPLNRLIKLILAFLAMHFGRETPKTFMLFFRLWRHIDHKQKNPVNCSKCKVQILNNVALIHSFDVFSILAHQKYTIFRTHQERAWLNTPQHVLKESESMKKPTK